MTKKNDYFAAQKELFEKYAPINELITVGNSMYYIYKGIKFARSVEGGRIMYRCFATYHDNYYEITSPAELEIIGKASHPNGVLRILHQLPADEYLDKINKIIAKFNS